MSRKLTWANIVIFSAGLAVALVVGCAAVQPTTVPASPATTTCTPLPLTATPGAVFTVTGVATEPEPTPTPTRLAPTATSTEPAPTATPTEPAPQPTMSSIDSDFSAELDREIERVLRRSDSPGLAVGVVKDQQLVYAKGFGVMNIKTGGEVTTRTLFHMASVTKPFVATSIVQLLEKERLSLDDRIVEHLPYFQMKDDRYATLTIRQFLTHSSGMPDVDDYHWDDPEYDEGALERYVRSLTDRELLFEPGERFSYSNMAFEVLGDLIAKVSGQSFAGYVKDHILLPLGMNDSNILIRDVDPALLANGHVQGDNGEVLVSEHYAYNRRHGPSSTLHSNVVDMSRWAIANMNRGELEGTRILDASSYELLWEPTVIVGTKYRRSVRLGLSWFLSGFNKQRMVYHAGGDIGYQTNFLMVPDAGVAVIVLSNYWGPESTVEDVARLALDLALDSG